MIRLGGGGGLDYRFADLIGYIVKLMLVHEGWSAMDDTVASLVAKKQVDCWKIGFRN